MTGFSVMIYIFAFYHVQLPKTISSLILDYTTEISQQCESRLHVPGLSFYLTGQNNYRLLISIPSSSIELLRVTRFLSRYEISQKLPVLIFVSFYKDSNYF